MSEAYWQAKIWGLLHDPLFKPLHNNTGRGDNSFWQELKAMEAWKQNNWNPETSGKKILEHIHLADYISSASDRGAIGSVTATINYNQEGLEISHLLSGAKLHWKIPQHDELLRQRKTYLNQRESQLRQIIPPEIDSPQQIKRLFWWLWRCLPEAACRELNDDSLLLMPAETRLPDSSLWSHASLTAALAGALAGYSLTPADIEQQWPSGQPLSHPYLASFTFTPVQELIKASRKMRDFWAGSWILHYICARISWKLACQYGPDTLLYPSLFQQPLIDHWLLQTYPEFQPWIQPPNARSLLTAGFPNVLVVILPKDKVEAAMQTAKQTVIETWRDLSQRVFHTLHQQDWMPDLQPESPSWNGWLNAQWQTYWAAVPLGKENESLKNAAIPLEQQEKFDPWRQAQNQAYSVKKSVALFQSTEIAFLREAYQQRLEKQGRKFSVNIGSWWPYVFDQTRLALNAVKNARNWQIPTAFGPRSTLSGLGPVVHPGQDWITEAETQKYWQAQANLFDGREQLNATETVKRGVEKILPELLQLPDTAMVAAAYPDLTAGVAGYLKTHGETEKRHFQAACQAIFNTVDWAESAIQAMRNKWGIPWMDEAEIPKKYHPRLLNAGWLVEDAQTPELTALNQQLKREKDPAIIEEIEREIRTLKIEYRQQIQQIIDRYYPQNNPANWYVLAAGDGDGMSEWLKGIKLKEYKEYIPTTLPTNSATFEAFLNLPKRMGPSTHNALSRALLDFSNQLVPYLTEKRYAGRLIYGGGDDVLAYLNLWEWDRWLWDIRQCFRGQPDPEQQNTNNSSQYFDNKGDYWRWQGTGETLPNRPLFTMGHKATISFGLVIANQAVPLAIALEHLWEAEKDGAKQHQSPNGDTKDAVQVRVIYSNGNLLKATAKFDVFHQWQQLLTATENLESALFEQAAQLWTQHPAPVPEAIPAWAKAFCDRRDWFHNNQPAKAQFQQALSRFLTQLWHTTSAPDLDGEIQNWLKLAAFVIRNRTISLPRSL